jgi:polyisoprenoid-binding protein YceI
MTTWKLGLFLVWASLGTLAFAQDVVLRCDPSNTAADFTLGDVLHTVHGTFQEKSCDFRFEPGSGKVSGEIIFDATSGNSGSEGRDRKMHKDVLESARYPDIAFRPDRIEGKVATSGTSTVQVHGMFAIHGAEHEITTPVSITFEADHWEASAHFPVPYAKWGMKNPSVLLLRVGDTVMIDLHAAGNVAALAAP